MNDASFSRRDSVGSLVDWSMITSKNPVFHIRLRGCRLVGLREKPRKFRSSSDSLFLCSSLNSGDIINEQFICDSEVSCWSSKQPDVSEITHRCPSFSGSAWPMHIPLGMIWFRNCRLVTQTSLFRYDMWIPWTV
ncbi:hypothetical protein TNCV_2951921 [Trichonephila clavipes]|nr:hypothetical protein TNCV_4411471 [Trichonephila clavipes]GFV74040.1 hypothetical protein TNCV_2951921 [Trichonephila clavipes]